jgi:Ca-activated chloride channel family protein
MPRHLTLADIGRGMSRHRAPRGRWVLPLTAALVVLVLTGGAMAVPRIRSLVSASGTTSGARCAKGTTPLVIAASVDKSAMLTRFGADFSAGGRDAQGRCVQVTVLAKSSGSAMTALVAGWPQDTPQPDVWSPSASLWLPLLEAKLTAAQQSSLIPAPADVPHIATSPMVVAMPRPMAEALGWPAKPIGWADLLQLATNHTGWATFGHPEWGPFLFGKTNPNFSNAGLEGTLAAYYAAVSRTKGLTPADIASAASRRFVAGVEQSIIRYGDTTTSFFSDWGRADAAGQTMTYISALVTEENLVAAYNDGNPTDDPSLVGKNPKPHVTLVAIYPKEGTFIADHPYAVLSAPWVTDAKRAAADAFLGYLRGPAVQRSFQANYFRDANGVAGAQTGTAMGLLPNQPTRTIEVPAAETTLAALDSWAQLRKTANVISLIDVSGSMAEPLAGTTTTRLDAAKQAAISSLSLFTNQDEAGLWSFSGGIKGVKDYTELVPIGPMSAQIGNTSRREAMQSSLEGLAARGNTGLYNSIAAAYRAVTERYRSDRINAIVVLTDGRNEAQGGLTLGQLLGLLQRDENGRSARVITIAYGPDADQTTLARIARATKGASYVAPGVADIPKVFSAALSNI